MRFPHHWQDTLLDTFREEANHQCPQSGDAQEDEDAASHKDRCKGCLVW